MKRIVLGNNQISLARSILFGHVICVLKISDNGEANGDPNFFLGSSFVSKFLIRFFLQRAEPIYFGFQQKNLTHQKIQYRPFNDNLRV